MYYKISRTRFLEAFKAVFVLIVLFFLTKVLVGHWNEFRVSLASVEWGWLTLSFLCLICHFVTVTLSFKYTVKIFTYKLNVSDIPFFKVSALTSLFRYIPGGVWNHVGKFHYLRQSGISTKKSIYINIVYLVFFVGSGIVLSLNAMLPIVKKYILDNGYILKGSITLIILAGLIIASRFRSFFVKLINDRMGGIYTSGMPYWRSRLYWYGLVCFLSNWIFAGLSLYILLLSFGEFDKMSLAGIISLYSFSWVVGFLFPLAPNGLGVREGILILGLHQYASQSDAILVAILFRTLVLFRDIIVGLFFSFHSSTARQT